MEKKLISGLPKIVIYQLLFLLLSHNLFSQIGDLRLKIEEIVKSSNGKVGFAFKHFGTQDTLTINKGTHYPMQSVYKLPLAMAVLNQVDQAKLSLNQKIHITKHDDLLPNTWSPLRDKYPSGNVDVPLSEILSYTVSQSDNNGCDILFRLMGGPRKVEAYIHGIGIRNIAISQTEEEMAKSWEAQFTNWSDPLAMLGILEHIHHGTVLSKTSTAFLIKILEETSTGPNRIRGLLPKATKVAHKTGTSDTNKAGITAAVNDSGIITLPNGNQFAMVVFVCDTPEDKDKSERIIASISKAIFDYYQ